MEIGVRRERRLNEETFCISLKNLETFAGKKIETNAKSIFSIATKRRLDSIFTDKQPPTKIILRSETLELLKLANIKTPNKSLRRTQP